MLGQRRPGRGQRLRRQARAPAPPRSGSAVRPGAPPSRPRRRSRQPVPGQQVVDQAADVQRRAPAAPAATAPSGSRVSVTSQVMWSAVEVSVTAATSRTAYPGLPGRGDHDGGRGVREERVRDDLLGVHPGRRRLDVQAGQLGAEQQRRPAPGGHEVAHRAEPGQRRVTAHVPDEEPLRVGRHAHVPGQQDVQPRAWRTRCRNRPRTGRCRRRRARRRSAPGRPPPCPAATPRPGSGASGARSDQSETSSSSGLTAACRVTTPEFAKIRSASARRAAARSGRRRSPSHRSLLGGRRRQRDAQAGDHRQPSLSVHHRGSVPDADDRTIVRPRSPPGRRSVRSGSPPIAATPSQSAQTSEVAGCSDPQRASR